MHTKHSHSYDQNIFRFCVCFCVCMCVCLVSISRHCNTLHEIQQKASMQNVKHSTSFFSKTLFVFHLTLSKVIVLNIAHTSLCQHGILVLILPVFFPLKFKIALLCVNEKKKKKSKSCR